MWNAPRPPRRLAIISTGCLALVLAIGGHHWIVASILTVATVLVGLVQPQETKRAAAGWALFNVALFLCFLLAGFNRQGIGLSGLPLLNTVGLIVLGVLSNVVSRKMALALCRQAISGFPTEIRPK